MMTLEPLGLQSTIIEAHCPVEASPYLEAVAAPGSTPGPVPRKRLDYPDKQRQSFGAVELSDHPPLRDRRRLPIQVVQEALTMEERAAVYTAHCMPWLFTTPMIEAGWRDPQKVLDNYSLRSRAELIAFVQHQIMPRIVEEIAMAELDDKAFSDPAVLLGIASAGPGG